MCDGFYDVLVVLQKFNKRRSEIQIISDILYLSQDGAKKTEILY